MSICTWILSDFRIGNSTQGIALAKELGFNYRIIDIKYNIFAKLPNFILWIISHLMPWHFYISNWNQENSQKHQLPDLIISSGRRTALVALSLKQIKPSIKIVQIMSPEIFLSKFDLIVLPKHDGISGKNIMQITGALNHIKPSTGPKEPFITVLVGGDTKNYQFSQNISNHFAELISHIADNQKMKMQITFSRRTPSNLQTAIRTKCHNHKIYDTTTRQMYEDMLKNAQFIITTCDSISMCSEAISSGTPTYIFIPENFKIKKHLSFISELLNRGLARKFNDSTILLEEYKSDTFNEASDVAQQVRLIFAKTQDSVIIS